MIPYSSHALRQILQAPIETGSRFRCVVVRIHNLPQRRHVFAPLSERVSSDFVNEVIEHKMRFVKQAWPSRSSLSGARVESGSGAGEDGRSGSLQAAVNLKPFTEHILAELASHLAVRSFSKQQLRSYGEEG